VAGAGDDELRRHRVDPDQTLDQVRLPLRPDQRQCAPVVDDQLA
jgi:hypothetical protein